MHDLGLKTFIQTFDTFVTCRLMGNQPWPQFQNGIRERSIKISSANLLYHIIWSQIRIKELTLIP